MGLILRQLPRKSGWQYAPHELFDIAEAISKRSNFFEYNQEQNDAIPVNPGDNYILLSRAAVPQ